VNVAERHHQVAAALLRLAHASDSAPNPYVVGHLSGHVAEGGEWAPLLIYLDVLDRLDPNALAADALRTVFGHVDLPPPIAAVIAARHLLSDADPADRPGLREIAAANLGWTGRPGRGRWTVRWAWCRRDAPQVPLVGHTSWVSALDATVLPDGRALLASGSADTTVRLWDPTTGTPVGEPLTGHSGWVLAVAFIRLPDGRTLLASGSTDRTVRLRDGSTGAPHLEPLRHRAAVRALAPVTVASGRVLLATGSDDGHVRLWDPVDGSPWGDPLVGHRKRVTDAVAVPRLRGSDLLATCSDDRTVRLWDPETGTAYAKPLSGHSRGARALTVAVRHSGDQVLACGCEDGRVHFWRIPPAGDPIWVTAADGHTNEVTSIAPLKSEMIASGSFDRTVRLWSRDGRRVREALTGHTEVVRAVSAVPLPDRRPLLASAGGLDRDFAIRLWNPSTANSGLSDDHPGAVVAAAAFSLPDRPAVVAGGAGGHAWFCSPDRYGGEPVRSSSRTGPVTAIGALALADGRVLVATGSEDTTVCLWDPATGAQVGEPLRGHTEKVLSVAAVPCEGTVLLASGAADSSLRLWDPLTGKQVGKPRYGHRNWVGAITSVPVDGRTLLATGGFDHRIRRWDPARRLRSVGDAMAGHTDWVRALTTVTLPGGVVLLASGSGDRTVRLWDPVTGAPVGEPLTGHTARVRALAEVSVAGRSVLASGSEDGTVRLWDPADVRHLRTVPIGKAVYALAALGPDLVVGCEIGLLVIRLPDLGGETP
jgi:WD40 repeat protein